MSELKFACPACGQHIECSKAYGGHTIHCPKCTVELRIPFSGAISGELSVLRAQIVDPAAAAKVAAQDTKEVRCICPVCESELRIATNGSTTHGSPPKAELVNKTPPPAPAEPKTAPAVPAPNSAPPSSTEERERQIAAAREARPVSLYPQIKPRLSFVLSGGEAPDPKENNSAPPEKDGAKPSDIKTINE